MFLVWGTQGESTSYIPGSIREKRRVEKVDRIRSTDHVIPHDPSTIREDIVDYETLYTQRSYQQIKEGTPKREQAILAKQILSSPVITLSPDASLVEAGELFRNKRFRHIPVLDQSGKLIGIVSDRDMLRESVKIRQLSHGGKDFPEPGVKNVMTTPVLTAQADTEIRAIARVLFEERIGAMPLMDDEGRLVGILTRSDILRTIMNHAPLELWI
jgi:acetoin utilization protein AcuB